jgi:hypothetical protein
MGRRYQAVRCAKRILRRHADFQTRRRNPQHQADWRRRRDGGAILTRPRLEVFHRDNSDDDGKPVPDLPSSSSAAEVGQPVNPGI